MHKTEEIVINTGPIISLIAATGNLDILKSLYKKVFVSYEVYNEILKGGIANFGIKEFEKASFLKKEISL